MQAHGGKAEARMRAHGGKAGTRARERLDSARNHWFVESAALVIGPE
jgi:hypothetical protein